MVVNPALAVTIGARALFANKEYHSEPEKDARESGRLGASAAALPAAVGVATMVIGEAGMAVTVAAVGIFAAAPLAVAGGLDILFC